MSSDDKFAASFGLTNPKLLSFKQKKVKPITM